ncbi:MAG: ABC transporter ATP-binding protein, partial [Planctomycetota bacterium]
MKISVDNLSIKYDGRALFEDVSFDVRTGQRYCINGPSGCGKSSLLRAMLGFVRPQQGEIYIGDTSVNQDTVWQLRHKIAYVTQEPDLGQQVVLDRIRRPFDYKANAHLKWNQQAVDEWFDRFKLPRKLLSKQNTELSGGEKHRIAIIIALLLD